MACMKTTSKQTYNVEYRQQGQKSALRRLLPDDQMQSEEADLVRLVAR